MKAIGIIGGMGPESTAYTYMKMIKYCQKKYKAKFDSDFPPIIIYSLPIEDVVEKRSNEAKIIKRLEFGIEKIKIAGARFGFINCNSMQKFIPKLGKNMEMISIAKEVVAKIKKEKIKKVGILATKKTIEDEVYLKECKRYNIEVIKPKRQEKITLAITKILEGKKALPKKILLRVIKDLRKEKIEGIILACTDLPIVLKEKDCKIKMFDSAKIIAEASIDRYYAENKPNERFL